MIKRFFNKNRYEIKTMAPIAITAITNFLLACEVFFFAGTAVQTEKETFSAAWYWSLTLILLGISAFLGGIDHGFFEAAGQPRFTIQRMTWLATGATTFGLLMTTAAQFFSARIQRALFIFGILQLSLNTIVVLLMDNLWNVLANYASVMLFLLIMNMTGLRNGKGSWPMISGILVLFAATAVEILNVDIFSPLDNDGLYHVVSMVGLYFLFLGGRRLNCGYAFSPCHLPAQQSTPTSSSDDIRNTLNK